MIKITFNPKKLELKIKGHAGQNKKGEDIVCSAVSSLFYTLAQSLIDSQAMLKIQPFFKDKDGDGCLRCRPKEEYINNIQLIYWVVLEGLHMVAQNYPKHVRFEEIS